VPVYYSNRDPVGPYPITVPARRMKPLRFTKLTDPEPATDYASTIEADIPIVVQSLNNSPQPGDALGAGGSCPPTWAAVRAARNEGEPPIP